MKASELFIGIMNMRLNNGSRATLPMISKADMALLDDCEEKGKAQLVLYRGAGPHIRINISTLQEEYDTLVEFLNNKIDGDETSI